MTTIMGVDEWVALYILKYSRTFGHDTSAIQRSNGKRSFWEEARSVLGLDDMLELKRKLALLSNSPLNEASHRSYEILRRKEMDGGYESADD